MKWNRWPELLDRVRWIQERGDWKTRQQTRFYLRVTSRVARCHATELAGAAIIELVLLQLEK